MTVAVQFCRLVPQQNSFFAAWENELLSGTVRAGIFCIPLPSTMLFTGIILSRVESLSSVERFLSSFEIGQAVTGEHLDERPKER